MKLLEVNSGIITLTWILVMIFLDMKPKAQATKAKISRWNYIKLKSIKRNNKIKRQPTEWEKIFANHISDKELIAKIFEEPYNSITKKTQLTKKMGR